jgi:hypothetical protein
MRAANGSSPNGWPQQSVARPVPPRRNHNQINEEEMMNTQTNQDEKENAKIIEIELNVEELEEVIAPGTGIRR